MLPITSIPAIVLNAHNLGLENAVELICSRHTIVAILRGDDNVFRVMLVLLNPGVSRQLRRPIAWKMLR